MFRFFRRPTYEKDPSGRSIIPIRSEADLEEFIQHPEKLPAGGIHLRSTIPIGPKHETLVDILQNNKRHSEAPIGLTGPAPQSLQAQLQERIRSILDLEWKGVAVPPELLEDLRQRANFANSPRGLSLPPAVPPSTEPGVVPPALDPDGPPNPHLPGPCPIEKWFQEDLTMLVAGVVSHLEDPNLEIALNCEGGLADYVPSDCKPGSMPPTKASAYTIRVSHAFYYLSLIAARACAANIAAPAGKTPEIAAKEINESLRSTIEWYLGDTSRPKRDTISARLLPHQLLVLDRILRGVRRFIVARELGHILFWKTGGTFSGYEAPIKDLRKAARLFRLTPDLEDLWVEEMASDVIAIKLLQDNTHADAWKQTPESADADSLRAFCWDYAGTELALSLWAHLITVATKAKKIAPNAHPLGSVRVVFVQQAYPGWVQKVGSTCTGALTSRLDRLWDVYPAPSFKFDGR